MPKTREESHYRRYTIRPRRPMGWSDWWEFEHDGYDGPEDGRCGTGRTLAECREQIDEMEDE